MLSMSKPMSSTQAENYYDKTGQEEYYLQSEGRFSGRLAEKLGIDGQIVDRQTFKNLLEGKSPDGSQQMIQAGKNNGEHRAGWDLTFSAPKSVSILAVADERVTRAVEEAAAKTLSRIEEKFSITRVSDGAGGQQKINTGNFCAANFIHHSSRELDPQLHVHNFIFNATERSDGYGALETRNLFAYQKQGGMIFRSELAGRLKKLGYGIEVTDRPSGFFEVNGVPQEVLAEFSKRREAIKARVRELKTSGKYPNMTYAELHEVAALETREAKSLADPAAVRRDWEERTQAVTGKNLLEIKNAALEIGEKELVDSPSPTVESYVKKAVRALTENDSIVNSDKIIDATLRLGLDRGVTIDQAKEAINKLEVDGRMIRLAENSVNKSTAWTTPEMVHAETYVADTVAYRQGAFWDKSVTQNTVEQHIEKFEAEKGFTLTDGQRQAVHQIMCDKNLVNIIQGDAGVGKTTSLSVIKQIIDHVGSETELSVRGMAHTGIASAAIKETGIPASTISSFVHNHDMHHVVPNNEIWIVDEAGMAGARDIARILELASYYGAKVVLTGDTKQLLPIGAGKPFLDIQQHSGANVVKMEESTRPKTDLMREVFDQAGNGDLRGAIETLTVNDFGRDIERFEAEKKLMLAMSLRSLSDGGSLVQEIANNAERFQAMVDDYVRFTSEWHDNGERWTSAIITGRNADRHKLNALVRENLVAAGRVQHGHEMNLLIPKNINSVESRMADSYCVGDVIKTMTRVGGQLSSNDTAEVIGVDKNTNKVTVRVVGGRNPEVSFDPSRHSGKFQVFQKVIREMGVGDRVVCLRNDRGKGVENGSIGTVVGIEDGERGAGRKNAVLQIKLDNGQTRQIDTRAYPTLDLAYAMTVAKEQGQTVDAPIFHADTSKGGVDKQATYTALTRGRYLTKVFTDDREGLEHAVEGEQQKRSTNEHRHHPKVREIINAQRALRGQELLPDPNARSLGDMQPDPMHDFAAKVYERPENDPLRGMIIGDSIRGFTARTGTAELTNGEKIKVRNVCGMAVDARENGIDPTAIRQIQNGKNGEWIRVYKDPAEKKQLTFSSAGERAVSASPRFSSSIERGNHGGRGWDATVGGVGFKWSPNGLFGFGERSFVTRHSWESALAPGYHTTSETRFIRSGQDKGSVVKSETRKSGVSPLWQKNETITRADGEKIVAKEQGYRSNLGIADFSFKRREERLPDGSKKISESKTFAGSSWGKSTIFCHDGTVHETTWSGRRTITGQFKIDSSTTVTYVKGKAAKLRPLTDRVVRAICQRLLKIKATLAGDHKTRVEIDRIIDEERGKGGVHIIARRDNLSGQYSKNAVIERKDGSRIQILEHGHKQGGTIISRRAESVLDGPNKGATRTTHSYVRRAEGMTYIQGASISQNGKEITERIWEGEDKGNGFVLKKNDCWTRPMQPPELEKNEMPKIEAELSRENSSLEPSAGQQEVFSKALSGSVDGLQGDSCLSRLVGNDLDLRIEELRETCSDQEALESHNEEIKEQEDQEMEMA